MKENRYKQNTDYTNKQQVPNSYHIQIFKYYKTIYIYIQHIKTVIYTQNSKVTSYNANKKKFKPKSKRKRS